MPIFTILYILSSFLLIYAAATIYKGNRQSPKHRAFGLLFVFMACWQQSALLITLVPLEQATDIFIYGLIPLLLGANGSSDTIVTNSTNGNRCNNTNFPSKMETVD